MLIVFVLEWWTNAWGGVLSAVPVNLKYKRPHSFFIGFLLLIIVVTAFSVFASALRRSSARETCESPCLLGLSQPPGLGSNQEPKPRSTARGTLAKNVRPGGAGHLALSRVSPTFCSFGYG